MVLDHVVAVINGSVILQSDVDEEMGYAVLQPFSIDSARNTPQRALQRLIDRDLILQQMQTAQTVTPPTPEEVQQRITATARRDSRMRAVTTAKPTPAGKTFCGQKGLTEKEVEAHWSQRMLILSFIQSRFGSGVRITPAEIADYYNKTLLPQFRDKTVKPPPLATVSSRIEEILLQQRVSSLLLEWLQSLKSEGSVSILDPAYGQVGTTGSGRRRFRFGRTAMSSLPPSLRASAPAGSISAWGYLWRVGGGLLLLLVLVVAGLLFYASTPHFSNLVRQRVINVLEDATGGRVELQSLHWSLRHLAVEVDGLTIHGLEGPGELPYAHVDRLYARAKILSLVDARLGLDFLEVDRPAVHLIVYPDGSTNQPTPKAKESSSGPATRTIFDLQANRVEVHDGMALLNQRAIPFQLAANDLGVVITYAPASDHYLGQLTCSDLTAQQGKAAAIHSKLDLSVEAARDAVDLKTLHFTTGKTNLQASGNLVHYANPQWKVSAGGTVELAEVTALGAVDGLRRGSVELAVTGQGSGASQYAAGRHGEADQRQLCHSLRMD